MQTTVNKLSTTTYVLLTLLCLVPLIGAMAGIALIIVGISRKTDKILIVLGCGGILFTITVYSSLFYFGSHSDAFKKGWDHSAVVFLNSTVKEIEFYKIVNGKYPDDLKTIRQMDSTGFLPAIDPSKGKGMGLTDSKEFYYSKQDSGYYLFSTGYDNTPFTNDDIYPSFSKDILAKTGLRLDKGQRN